jgi:ribosomal protein S12 methylthiotransferase
VIERFCFTATHTVIELMAKPSAPREAAPLRVGLISLGCAKNLVDAEIMIGTLARDGIEITNDARSADVLIVNTCSFIDSAQEESVDAILESSELREVRKAEQGLVVSGCLSQRFRQELPTLLPEVDAFMGIDQVAQVGEIVREAHTRRAAKLLARTAVRSKVKPGKRAATSGVQARSGKAVVGQLAALSPGDGAAHDDGEAAPVARAVSGGAEPIVAVHARPTFVPDFATPRFRLTPKHFAYVKIAEGCNHPCSFCTIPRMRGSHRSRAQSDVVREAKQLIREGVRELNLISQDSTYYGLDLRPCRVGSIAAPDRFREATEALPEGATTLATLLEALHALRGDFWVRLLYTHPAHWTDGLIETLARCRKVVRYVDMPLQHIHPVMLERMRRETTREYIVDLIRRIRAALPGIAIRTTFIVGFPGETEEHFETLLQFIRETRFERLGVFCYSREEGTRAGQMTAQVTEAVKRKRRDRAMAEQLQVARNHAAACVGRTMKVLVEKAASTQDLPQAAVTSWEHGLIRQANADATLLTGRYAVARGEADAPDIDGRVYVGAK